MIINYHSFIKSISVVNKKQDCKRSINRYLSFNYFQSLRSVTALASNLQFPNINKHFQNSPASEVRSELLNSFLDCVQQCQVRYGGKTELASEKDTHVSELCASLEAVISHGLRISPVQSNTPVVTPAATLKNVSKLISGRLHLTEEKQGEFLVRTYNLPSNSITIS